MGESRIAVMAAILAPVAALAQAGGEGGTPTARTGFALLWWVVAFVVLIALLVLLLGGRARRARR
jgi:hypothetical protein